MNLQKLFRNGNTSIVKLNDSGMDLDKTSLKVLQKAFLDFQKLFLNKVDTAIGKDEQASQLCAVRIHRSKFVFQNCGFAIV
jgi:hypothetical protein